MDKSEENSSNKIDDMEIKNEIKEEVEDAAFSVEANIDDKVKIDEPVTDAPPPSVTLNIASRPVRIRREKYSRFKDSITPNTSSSNDVSTRRTNTRLRPSSKFRGLSRGASSASFSSRPTNTKGKSRRSITRGVPVKAASSFATIVPKNWVFFKGDYYQIGDIISLLDVEGETYFAQIRGLLQDQYGEKSCVLTWLLPTLATPNIHEFDAASFILGPDEEVPRSLSAVSFVCHCPADYYRTINAPFETRSRVGDAPELGFVCTRIGHEVHPAPSADKICWPVASKSPVKTESKEELKNGKS